MKRYRFLLIHFFVYTLFLTNTKDTPFVLNFQTLFFKRCLIAFELTPN